MVVAVIGILLLIIVLSVLIKLDNEEKRIKKNATEILDGLYSTERIASKMQEANRSLASFKIKHKLNSK